MKSKDSRNEQMNPARAENRGSRMSEGKFEVRRFFNLSSSLFIERAETEIEKRFVQLVL